MPFSHRVMIECVILYHASSGTVIDNMTLWVLPGFQRLIDDLCIEPVSFSKVSTTPAITGNPT